MSEVIRDDWARVRARFEELAELAPAERVRRLDELERESPEIGRQVRELMVGHGYPSVAAEGFQAPGVVVSYTTDPDIQNSKKFLALGLQTAAGVPLQCDEPADFRTFRVGLFGLEKWHNVARSVDHLSKALEAIDAAR